TSAQWPQCSCAEIQAADVSRHFRECLRRAVYPKPSAPKPQPVEPQGPDRCRKGTPGCTVDHTGLLGGYSECVKTNPQPVEPAKVGALTQRIRDQQNAPDDGSVPFVVRCPSLDVEPAKVGLSECEVANCPEPAPDHAGGRHYCAQHLANVNAGRRPDVDEPAKVVSVISLSDRPQSVEPAKVEPPKRLALVRDAESGSWDEAVQSGPHAVDYVLASIHDATQAALAPANAADEAHRKGCDIAMAALAQAAAERDRAVALVRKWRVTYGDDVGDQPLNGSSDALLTDYDAKKGGAT